MKRAQGANLKRLVIHEVRDDAAAGLKDDFIEQLRSLFQSDRYRPPMLPAAALRVMELARMAEPEFNAISFELEKDPLLAARVLRLANSASHGGGQKVESIKSALVRLGVGAVKNLVLQEAMSMRVFRSRSYRAEAELVQRHCVATAHAARAVARFTSLSPEYLYAVGLLHDVGIVVGLGALETLTGPQEIDRLPSAVYWPVLHALHSEVNALICEKWRLDTDMALLLRHHHDLAIDGYRHPALCTLALAEVLVDQRGFGVTRPSGRRYDIGPAKKVRPDERGGQDARQATQELGLNAAQLRATIARVETALQESFGQ